jgi:CRISPR-associated protein (Cas_Cas02710)
MAKRSWIKAALKEPEKHPFLFLFVITIALAVAGNGISNLILENICTWLSQVTLISKLKWQILLILAIILGLSLSITNISSALRRLFGNRPLYMSKVKPLAPNVSCKGLIVFMSKTPPNQTSPAESAILHHWNKNPRTIRYCWIICGGKVINVIAETMINDHLKEQQQSINFIYGDHQYPNPEDKQQVLSLLLPSESIDDPNYIRQLIEAIYVEAEELQIQENEIFIDYTGGNKSMTAGAVLAGSDPQRRVQYIHNDFDDQGNIDWNSTVMMEVDISYQVKPVADRSE